MFKKWSTKKKILMSVSLLLVLSVIAGISYYLFKPDPGEEVILTKVFTGDITQTLDATGTVESANQGRFSILEGTKVTSVNFRVGDRIKKGDILATFDTESLKSLVSEKQKAYNSAYETYLNYKNSASNTDLDLEQTEKDIKKLEAEISTLEAKITGSEDNTEDATETTASSALQSFFSSLFGNNMISNILNGGSGSSFDFSSITGMSTDETKLTSLQLELLQLKAKKTLAQAQASGTLESTLKSLYESSLEDLNTTKSAVEELKIGWIAKDDGIIRDIKITAGQSYKNTSGVDTDIDISTLINLLSSSSDTNNIMNMIKQFVQPVSEGMVIEYYPFAASFILGKYDILKVIMDQEVVITAPNGSVFKGNITYISPVASSSDSINISSLLGTSGSSSGVIAKVSIPNPDEGVIIGFDVDISIDVGKAENTLLVPSEAIQFDSDGSYVFTYDSKEKVVSRKKVETGIFSGSLYQITSGCEAGEVIIKAPSLALMDGDKVTVKSTEDPTLKNIEETTAKAATETTIPANTVAVSNP